MRIRYIGQKAKKHDNVANTGITWLGNGDEQEVSDPIAASQLLANDTIWVLADPDTDGALVAALLSDKESGATEAMIPAALVRAFVEMLLAADRLSVADLPVVCNQLGMDPADITVPPIAAAAPAAPSAQAPSPDQPPATPAAAPAATQAPATAGKRNAAKAAAAETAKAA